MARYIFPFILGAVLVAGTLGGAQLFESPSAQPPNPNELKPEILERQLDVVVDESAEDEGQVSTSAYEFDLTTTTTTTTTTSSPADVSNFKIDLYDDIDNDKETETDAAASNRHDYKEEVEDSDPEQELSTSILKNKVIKITTNDLRDDLLDWEAPEWFQKHLPYYLSGYDHEGRPVWIAEIGKYPLKELGELDEDGLQDLDKYLKQAAVRIIESIESQDKPDREVTEAVFIFDMDGLNVHHLPSSKSVLLISKTFKAYRDLIDNYMGECIIINGNYVAKLVLSLVRPLLSRAAEKVEVFGTNAAKWKAALHRKLPKISIPTWYGGSKDFKPIKFFGKSHHE